MDSKNRRQLNSSGNLSLSWSMFITYPPFFYFREDIFRYVWQIRLHFDLLFGYRSVVLWFRLIVWPSHKVQTWDSPFWIVLELTSLPIPRSQPWPLLKILSGRKFLDIEVMLGVFRNSCRDLRTRHVWAWIRSKRYRRARETALLTYRTGMNALKSFSWV